MLSFVVVVVAVVVVLSKFCRFSVVTAASIGRGSLKFGGEMQAGRTLLFSSFFFFFSLFFMLGETTQEHEEGYFQE